MYEICLAICNDLLNVCDICFKEVAKGSQSVRTRKPVPLL